jgi:hypothetical protein
VGTDITFPVARLESWKGLILNTGNVCLSCQLLVRVIEETQRVGGWARIGGEQGLLADICTIQKDGSCDHLAWWFQTAVKVGASRVMGRQGRTGWP